MHKICIICGIKFKPKTSSKCCSKLCSENNKKSYMRNHYLQRYKPKGYNQSGENNNNWTGGIGTYRKVKPRKKCELCPAKQNLVVHHKDEDRYNNKPENLQVLCRSCHVKVHDFKRDSEGKFTAIS